jgi:hypothetical protein
MTLHCFERALSLASDDTLADVWYNIGQVRTCDNRQTHSVKPSVGSRRGVLVSWLYIWDVPPQVAMGIGDLGLAYQVRVSRRTALPALVLIWVAVWLAGV